MSRRGVSGPAGSAVAAVEDRGDVCVSAAGVWVDGWRISGDLG